MQINQNDLSELDELTEEHLGFSALSSGLGFSGKRPEPNKLNQDPLKDFLSDEPATGTEPKTQPLNRNRYQNGIGAVSAGPARPVSIRPQAQILPNPFVEPAAPIPLRLISFLIDLTIVLGPFAAAWQLNFGSSAIEFVLEQPLPPLMLISLMLAVYFLLSESFGGQSVGKMLLGLRVVEDDKYQKPTGFKHTALRLPIFLLGAALAGIGLFAAFTDKKKRPWHDRLTGSIVRRKN